MSSFSEIFRALIVRYSDDPKPSPIKPFKVVDNNTSTLQTNFYTTLRAKENSVNNPDGGYDKKLNRWGIYNNDNKASIGYGHVFTQKEINTNKLLIENEYYDIRNGLTDSQAQRLHKQDTEATVNTAPIFDVVKKATDAVKKGVPYVWGGEDIEKGADCSGLIQCVFKDVGVNLPRTAQTQAKSNIGKTINNMNDVQVGDVLYFKTPRNSKRNVSERYKRR